MADDAIGHIKMLNETTPDKPFFVYYVPGATHAPHHPTKEWVEKFKGKFDHGYNEERERIFNNQKRLGVIPANAKLTPWPDSVPRWDTLDAQTKKMLARQAEVYAGFLAYTDHEIGRVIQAVEDMGKLDNTLIIYIGGDNGASPEGTTLGTPNEFASFNSVVIPIEEQLKYYDDWGFRQDLSALRRGLGLGVQHAVQVDQAGRVALRRHAAGHGDVLARPHQGHRRHPSPVPSRH